MRGSLSTVTVRPASREDVTAIATMAAEFNAYLASLAEIGRKEECERIMWSVWSKNEKAQRFYESLGAVPAEEEILMEWSIQVARGKPKAQ